MNPSGREQQCAKAGAYWRWSQRPEDPHVILTSGRHSDGYFNCTPLISQPGVLAAIVTELKSPLDLRQAPDRVVGTAYGSITLAYELARQLGCYFAFTERTEKGPASLDRFPVRQGESVLLVQAHPYRNSPLDEAIAAVRSTAAELLPHLVTLINDSGRTNWDGLQLLSPAEVEQSTWLTPPQRRNALIDNPASIQQLMASLVGQLRLLAPPDWVIGADLHSIAPAYELARRLGCRAGFVQRTQVKSGPLQLRCCEIGDREHIVVCDDVLTTGGTTVGTIRACLDLGAAVLEHVGVIANRHPSSQLIEDDQPYDIIRFLDAPFPAYDPAGGGCPCCAAGSEAVSAKNSWERLTKTATSVGP